MSFMEDFQKEFNKGGHELNSPDKQHTIDILYNQLKPRWKWFKPPLSIHIGKFEISMMWAYKIYKAILLKNAYPSSISSTIDDKPKDFTLTFASNVIKNDAIDRQADYLKKLVKGSKDLQEYEGISHYYE